MGDYIFFNLYESIENKGNKWYTYNSKGDIKLMIMLKTRDYRPVKITNKWKKNVVVLNNKSIGYDLLMEYTKKR